MGPILTSNLSLSESDRLRWWLELAPCGFATRSPTHMPRLPLAPKSYSFGGLSCRSKLSTADYVLKRSTLGRESKFSIRIERGVEAKNAAPPMPNAIFTPCTRLAFIILKGMNEKSKTPLERLVPRICTENAFNIVPGPLGLMG